MAAVNYEQVMRDLGNKVYHPVYLLGGEESYYIDCISDYIEKTILGENEKEFNLTVLYGRDTDAETILSVAKRYPMMANHNVVIVKEAQSLRQWDGLLPYMDNPLKSTLLVLCYRHGKPDRRKSVIKKIARDHVYFESARLYDNKVPEWIMKYVVGKGYSLSPKTSVLLSEYLGNDLVKIVKEMEKLFLNIPAGNEIRPEDIETYVGISREFNHFELQNALGQKNVTKTNKIAGHFMYNPKKFPLQKTIVHLYYYFVKILTYHSLKDKSTNNVAAALSVHPFFVRDFEKAGKNYPISKIVNIIEALKSCDLQSKGIGNISLSERELLRELVYRILH